MIRAAVKADIGVIIEMGRRFAGEMYAGHIEIDDVRTAAVLDDLLDREDRLLLVHEADGHVDGMLGAFLFDHPFSGELVAGELFWWVEPERRGAGVKLLRAMEKWAA